MVYVSNVINKSYFSLIGPKTLKNTTKLVGIFLTEYTESI